MSDVFAEELPLCELFGVSTSQPVRLFYSLDEFAKHGGSSHANRSGWGIAYYQERDVLLIREALPAAGSAWVRFLEDHGLLSHCTISHVRYASVGAETLVNTHPFRRELGGRMHVFAHNGSLPEIRRTMPYEGDQFRAVGETDSEFAFCLLLQRLANLWQLADGDVPPIEARMHIVQDTAAAFRQSGTANFLYADGDVLFAHAHKRRFDEGGAFGPPKPPGLCLGNTREVARGLDIKWPVSRTDGLMVASVPLTKNGWTPIDEGTVLAIRDGKVVARGGCA